MAISQDAQAVVLLTARLGNSRAESVKPLTITEWNRFVTGTGLKDGSYTPADLLTGNLSERLGDWSDATITPERIDALLNRGMALALHMEKWQRSGIWVMVRSTQIIPQAQREIA